MRRANTQTSGISDVGGERCHWRNWLQQIVCCFQKVLKVSVIDLEAVRAVTPELMSSAIFEFVLSLQPLITFLLWLIYCSLSLLASGRILPGNCLLITGTGAFCIFSFWVDMPLSRTIPSSPITYLSVTFLIRKNVLFQHFRLMDTLDKCNFFQMGVERLCSVLLLISMELHFTWGTLYTGRIWFKISAKIYWFMAAF